MADIFEALSKFSPIPTDTGSRNQTTDKAPRLETKQDRLPTIKNARDLGMIQAANRNPDALDLLTLSRQRGNTLGADNKILNDWDSMGPAQFIQKYGVRTYDELNAFTYGGRALNNQANAQQTDWEQASDAATGVASGAVQGALGLAAMANLATPAGFANPALSKTISGLSQSAQDLFEGAQSDALNQRRYVDALRAQLDSQDNARQYEEEAPKDGTTMATLKWLGREGVSGAGRWIEDPKMFEAAVASGVGSLAVGGPASKVIGGGAKAVNRALSQAVSKPGSRAAQVADEAVDAVSFPLAIAGLEGGSVMNESYQEVINTDHKTLGETSPEYRRLLEAGMSPDAARERLAYNKGGIAAAITAPIAGVAGRLVEGFEKAPLRNVNSLPANMAREFAEETIQSGAGQLSSNVGTRLSGVDPKQGLAEDVTTAAVQGGIAGAGTAGALQGPGVALKATAKAAAAPFKYTFGALAKYGEKNEAARKATSNLTDEKVQESVRAAEEAAPAVAEAISRIADQSGIKGGEKKSFERFKEEMVKATQTTEEDLADLPENFRAEIDGAAQQAGRAPNRFETMMIMAGIAMDERRSKSDRISAAIFIDNMAENNKNLFEDRLPKFLDRAPRDTPEYKEFEAYRQILRNMAQSQSLNEAMEWAYEEMDINEGDVEDVVPGSAEGRELTEKIVTIAERAPERIDPDVAQTTLKQADEGKIELSPEQRQIIMNAVALRQSGRIYEAEMRVVDKDQIIENKSGIDFVAQQIETGGGRSPSLKTHVSRINSAIKSGDKKAARRSMQHLSLFARHMRNKLEAINTAIQNKDGKRVSYQALGQNMNWLPKDGRQSVYFNPRSEASERLARTVAAEAKAAAELANDFARRYPEYGVKEIAALALALPERDENITAKIPAENTENRSSQDQAVTKGSSQTAKATTQSETRATTAKTRKEGDNTRQTELPTSKTQAADIPIKPAPKTEQVQVGKSRVTAEQAARLSDEGLNKRLDYLAGRRADGKETPDDQATFLVLNEEMTRREDEAAKAAEVEEALETEQEVDQQFDQTIEGVVEEAAPVPALVNQPAPQPAEEAEEDIGLPGTLPALPGAVSGDATENERRPSEEVFPDLVKADGANWFHKAYLVPQQAISRLTGLKKPLLEVYKLLSQPVALVDFMGGKDFRYNVLPSDLANFQELMKYANLALKYSEDRVLKVLETPVSKGSKETHADLLRAGTNPRILRWRRTRPFNLLERKDDGFAYNTTLMESAAIAGLDWLLNSPTVMPRMDRDEIARLLGIDISQVTPEHEKALVHGMSLDMAKRGLAQHIRKFWGVVPNRETPQAYTQGIAEGVAAELLRGFDEANLLRMGTVKFAESPKDFNRVWFDDRPDRVESLVKDLRPVSRLLSDVALTKPDKGGYAIGEPIEEVPETQHKNPTVKLTPLQRQAIARMQRTPFKINPVMLDFVTALGKDRFRRLMGGIDFEPGDLNEEHQKSVEGKNRSLDHSFENVLGRAAEISRHAEKAGVNAEEMPIYFGYNVTSIGRLQMLALSNPAGDKLAREIFLPTESTLDLSDTTNKDFSRFLVMIAQGIGIKTEQKTRQVNNEKVIEDTMTEGGKFRPIVTSMKTWLKNSSEYGAQPLPDELYGLLIDSQLSNHGIHALFELARYENARDDRANDLHEFKTKLYLEADGKTNGPINAMMLFGTGQFTPEFLMRVAKGGVFLGNPNKTLNTHEDEQDLYGEGAYITQQYVAKLGKELSKESPQVYEQFLAFRRVLAELNIDVSFDPDSGEIAIKRGLTKNPLTITIYGSGLNGIAGNIAGELVDTIYAFMSAKLASEQAGNPMRLHPQFKKDLDMLMSMSVRENEDGKKYLKKTGAPFDDSNSRTARLTPFQFRTLQNNVFDFLVDPMSNAIEEVVTQYVRKTTTALQEATQLQSVVLREMFHNEIMALLAEKKLNTEKYPDYREGDFVSQKELDIIIKNLEPFSPKIETGSQTYMMSGRETADLFQSIEVNYKGQKVKISMPDSFARSLFDDLDSPVFVHGPALAGVRAIPTLTIGSGDGQMVLNAMTDGTDLVNRTLQVYDGINMPGDKIEDYSYQVNEAVYKSWVTNPMRAVAESFGAFARTAPLDVLLNEKSPFKQSFDNTLLEISKIISGSPKPKEIVSVEAAKNYVNQLAYELSHIADDIDDRQKVLSEVDLAIDQMASGESPYVRIGGKSVRLTDRDRAVALPERSLESIADEMNNRYMELREQRRIKESGKTAVETPTLKTQDIMAEWKKAKVIWGEGKDDLDLLFGSTGDKLQVEMARNSLRLLRQSGYRIVVGTPDQLDAWELENDPAGFEEGVNHNVYGKTNPVSKVILIPNVTPETLTHELIHAATIDKVKTFYDMPDKLSQEDREAVFRIEGLMQEWLLQDYGGEHDYVQTARRQAMSSIAGHLNEGRQAEAVNEFMAWVLANQHLARIAGKTKVRLKILRVVGDALAAIRQLIWGGKNKGPTSGDTLLSNLRFNTRVLMGTPSPVDAYRSDAMNTALYQSSSFGTNNRLREIRRKFTEAISAFTRENSEEYNKVARKEDAAVALADAKQTASIFAYHFPGMNTPQARSTFEAIQATLMTDAMVNANALSRIEDIYAHVMRNLSVTELQDDPTSDDPADRQNAQDRYDALVGNLGTATDKRTGRTNLMASFLALAVVDDNFRKVLKNKPLPKDVESSEQGLDGFLENTAMAGMNRVSRLMAGERSNDKTVIAALDSLTNALIDKTGDQQTFIEKTGQGLMDTLDNLAVFSGRAVADYVDNKTRNIIDNPNTRKYTKAAAQAANVLATVLTDEGGEAASNGLIGRLNRLNGYITLREMVVEIHGRTKSNATVYDMISKVRSAVQQVRQQFRTRLPVELRNKFSRKLSPEEWTAMFKVLGKTDLASLYGKHGLRALDFLVEPRKLAAEIRLLETEIQQADPSRFLAIQDKSRQLANYLNTGETGVDLLRNAKAVSQLFGNRKLFRDTVGKDFVDKVDQLITLYALDQVDQNTRDMVSGLTREQLSGMEFVFAYLNGLRNDELSKLDSPVAEVNHYKGYIPSEKKAGASLIVARDVDHFKLIQRGYTRVGAYTGSDADHTLQASSYYYAPDSGRAAFNQGVMQTVHQTASGIDPDTGFTMGEIVAGRVTEPRAVRRITNRLSTQRATSENLMPVYNEKNQIIAYERGVDPNKLAPLTRDTDLVKMMGVWQGRQVEEELGHEFNDELVKNAKDIWNRGRKEGNSNEFVNLARITRRQDPVLYEAWRLVPRRTKKRIEEEFGRNQFWVRRDMLNDVVGFRQASVGDLFTGDTRWDPRVVKHVRHAVVGMFDIVNKGDKAYQYLVASERVVQDFVTDAKLRIVVKSVIVPAANMMANVYQLANRGVPIRNILKGIPSKTSEINDYIKRRNREIQLGVDLKAAEGRGAVREIRKLKTELQSIQDAYKKMSIWPLIESGEFSAISDGAITQEDLEIAEGRWTDYVERFADKLPPGIKTAYRYGLITRDTALFQGLARAMQYGDFVAKAILYEDMVQRQKIRSKDALGAVGDAFVNYNRQAGRTRNYFDSIGLTWFWHFKIRSMKEAAWLIRNRPIRTLLLLGLPGGTAMDAVGSPVTDNFVSSWWDDRIGYSIGPEMGFDSFGLNPWVNLAN